jgi:hypothetical protein
MVASSGSISPITQDNVVLLLSIKCHLCGLVVRALGYRSGGPWFNSRHNQKKK